MPIVRIIANNQSDRLKSLSDGIFTFGSDFGCDVVLIDEGILPIHFRIEIQASMVTVWFEAGAQGTLHDHEGQITPLEPGVVTVWHSNQNLRSAGIELQISGLPVVLAKPKRSQAASAIRNVAGTSWVKLLGGTAVAASLVMANTQNLFGMSRDTEPSTKVRMSMVMPQILDDKQSIGQSASALSPESAAKLNKAELLAHLQAAGFNSLDISSEGFNGVFYLERSHERDALTALIEQEGLQLRATTHLRSQLMSAINITLDNVGGDAKLASLDAGDVTLLGLRGNTKRRDEVIQTIRRDVPGVKSVHFRDAASSDARQATDQITAVWAGQRPYVVLNDGRIVRPGQQIADDIALFEVLSTSRITLTRDGINEEVSIQ
jgi:hypothetical protein